MTRAIDPVTNFAIVEVSTGYDDDDTAITLVAGGAAKLPDPAASGAFNLVWFNSTDYTDPSDDPNVEIVRCTGIAGEVLTVTRNQESSGASTKNAGSKTYKMILCMTKLTLDAIDTRLQNLVDAEGVTGLVKCNGSGDFSAAAAGTDYSTVSLRTAWLNTQIFS